jgi:hypothetical protein
MQECIVAIIVVAAVLHLAWRWMPARWRQALRLSSISSGKGSASACGSCDACGPSAPADACSSQPGDPGVTRVSIERIARQPRP